jgi:diguanylate cyclase (GGDEF)-like protein
VEAENDPPTLGAAEELIASPQFQHIVQGFERACGLKLHAYTVTAVPLDVPFDPPAFCQTLQAGMHCPLYFDPVYHTCDKPELRPSCAGLGHVVIPVKGTDGSPLVTLVSQPLRIGPVDMDEIATEAFSLKVFPDTLAAQAEDVTLAAKERIEFASQMVFAGLNDLVAGHSDQAGAVGLIIAKIADAAADEVPDAILAAALEFCDAEFAYINLVGAHGEVVESGNVDTREPWYRILQGLGQWVVYAGKMVDLPDVRGSAWSQHLAREVPPPGALVGMPLSINGTSYGSIVVGGPERGRLAEWTAALAMFTQAGGDALVLARRLVEVGDGSMVDGGTGAYNLRFLEELLEKEISRAGRHHHHLSLVVFHLSNHAELLSRLGNKRAELILGQMVELIRSRTRKVNSLARVSDTDFCLVIPEAAEDVAEKIADELCQLAQSADYSGDANGNAKIRIVIQTRTVVNPPAVDVALQGLLLSPN